MNIEIHQPELESLIHERMATGRFRDIEDVLLEALQRPEKEAEPANRKPVMNLSEVFARARKILAGEELIIERDPSPGHPVDLS